MTQHNEAAEYPTTYEETVSNILKEFNQSISKMIEKLEEKDRSEMTNSQFNKQAEVMFGG